MKVLDDFATASSVNWSGEFQRGEAQFPDGRAGARATGRIETEELEQNWTGSKSLQFSVFNPWDHPVIGGIDIYDQTSLDSPELEFGDCISRGRCLMYSEGVTHVVIRIDPIQTTQGGRMLDLENVRRVALSFPKPAANQPPLSVSNFRLCDPATSVDESANAKPMRRRPVTKWFDPVKARYARLTVLANSDRRGSWRRRASRLRTLAEAKDCRS